MPDGRKSIAWLLIASLGIVLAGCGPQPSPTVTVRLVTAGPQTQSAGPTASVGAYPGPQTQSTGTVATSAAPYPGPPASPSSTAQAGVFVIPTPTGNAGVVTGQLLDGSGKPYLGAIYAGRAIYPNQATAEPIISFSNQDPIATQDPDTGKFAIGALMPGSYGLLLWTPGGEAMVTDAKTGSHVLFQVSAGKTTDLGVVTIH